MTFSSMLGSRLKDDRRRISFGKSSSRPTPPTYFSWNNYILKINHDEHTKPYLYHKSFQNRTTFINQDSCLIRNLSILTSFTAVSRGRLSLPSICKEDTFLDFFRCAFYHWLCHSTRRCWRHPDDFFAFVFQRTSECCWWKKSCTTFAV